MYLIVDILIMIGINFKNQTFEEFWNVDQVQPLPVGYWCLLLTAIYFVEIAFTYLLQIGAIAVTC